MGASIIHAYARYSARGLCGEIPIRSIVNRLGHRMKAVGWLLAATPWLAVVAGVTVLAYAAHPTMHRRRRPAAAPYREVTKPTLVGSTGDQSTLDTESDRPAYVVPPPPAPCEKSYTIHDSYELGAVVGKGSFGTVVLATHRSSRRPVAVKIMDNLSLAERREAMKEYTLLKRLHHDNVVRAYECFVHGPSVRICLEYVPGGSLADRMRQRRLHEREIHALASGLLRALQHCHANGVVHRDIKPANVLLLHPDDLESAKLADFGLAERIFLGPLHDRSGTEDFMAPEVKLRRPYGTPADIYSLGVLLHILIADTPPRMSYCPRRRAIAATLDGHAYRHVSRALRLFVQDMLVVDAAARPTADTLLEHPYMRYGSWTRSGSTPLLL
ncbi:serine/threonine protein kinase [Saprolegnia diclina VS20]|uniref:Serine/threonine protein kinase n=1 Tax=Saprolegnia diclina (strain VS20) TaxID=1156394 RepID=T0S4S7_SAPDV|nr:serine/threonine protein kinase [Saprolegnia diclina VS20]EQC40063.1 serine/threonine protein kinase [Saprolegnia diclina VS20]|eukprot:XP_008606537.1 serine/threonine protein kinase [Saprolegnia diclina VS20]